MKFTVYFQHEWLPTLLQKLGDKVTILPQDNEFLKLEIEISNSLDLLNVFHAGTITGYNDCKQLILK
jgi:hypothetical protein